MTITENEAKPLIGISSCLLGNQVRYDGKHKYNPLIHNTLSPYATLLPICPEAMAGLGIPRPPVNLVYSANGIQAIDRENHNRIVTKQLLQMGKVITHTYTELSGFIVQSRSPSCGFQTTPIYDATQNTILEQNGSGLFIDTLHQKWPDLPILNSQELTPSTITTFLKKVSCYQSTLHHQKNTANKRK